MSTEYKNFNHVCQFTETQNDSYNMFVKQTENTILEHIVLIQKK